MEYINGFGSRLWRWVKEVPSKSYQHNQLPRGAKPTKRDGN